MYQKIVVTSAEMLRMREEGMSNHDIAKSLDIAYSTVLRYIGKQGRKMEGLQAFKDDPPKRKEERKEETMKTAKYSPKPVKEAYELDGARITLHNDTKMLCVESKTAGGVGISYDSLPELVEFLAWVMRERMEETPDEVRES